MEIKTEADMVELCEKVKGFISLDIQENLGYSAFFPILHSDLFEVLNETMIQGGVIAKGSHLQQGIEGYNLSGTTNPTLTIFEIPCLYPSSKLIEVCSGLTSPMTGNLSNCYDPKSRRFLFHMRGTSITAPFCFQAAAAGMGRFREHPYVTAKKEGD